MSLISLKGVSGGLRLRIERPLSQDQIQAEVIPIFERIRTLAAGAKITLDAGGQEAWILPFLKDFLVTEYQVADVVAADPGSVQSLENRTNPHEGGRLSGSSGSDTLMVCGRVRSGQHIQHKGHLLLMGDLNPGGEITAGGDVIVLGGLYGSVFAGYPEREDAIIVAIDFRPTSVHIAGHIYTGQPRAAKGTATYAKIQDGNIVVEPYMDNPPYAKLPWPETR